MRKIYLLLVTVVLFAFTGVAQTVVVAGADAVTLAGNPYSNLGAAFTNINAASQAGNIIIITVTGTTVEPASAVLNAGTWTSMNIIPVGASAITGNIAGHLIDLNGADNVTIDGLNSGGNSLAINNSDPGSGTSTIRFINDATSNSITRCNILGSAGNTLGTGFGIIFFSTGTVTGNDNNSITQCNISPSSGGTPLNAIYSLGTSAAIDNSSNTISINNLADYFSATTACAGMNINTGNSGWTITNNALYQTATRTFTVSGTHNGIVVTSGSGYTISNNIIGFANPASTGTTNMIGLSAGSLGGTFPGSFTGGGTAVALRYNAINCAFTAGGAVSSIQNNTIGGIALYTSSGATTTFGIICGIAVTSGNANIGTVTGNTIGSSSGTSSIYAASTTAGAVISGIYCTTTNTITIQNNNIGGIDVSGTTATTASGFKGIEGAGAGNYTISNNNIGNTVANNIRTGYLLTAGNLSNTATTPTTATGASAIQGILSSATGTSMSITGNTLRGFQESGSVTSFTGINSTGGVTGTIDISTNNLGTSSTNLLAIAFATSGGILCINNSGGSAACALTANNNIFQGLSYNNECSGSFRCLNNSGTLLSCTMNNNNFKNITVNTTASTFGFLIGGTSNTPTVTLSGNYVTTQFSNITLNGAPNYFAFGCATPAISTGSSTITNNNLSNITFRTTTSFGAAIYWTDGNIAGSAHNITMSNNVVSNLTNNGTATTAGLYGIVAGYGNINVLANNIVTGLYGKAQVIGLLTNAASGNAAGSFTVNNNTVYNINSSTASSQAQGIQCAAGPTQNIFKNKVYDIVCNGAGTVIGLIESSAAAGTTANIYNNYIGRLYAPNTGFYQGVRGITFGSTLANTVNLYYNTVYIDGNAGVQTYCMYVPNTTMTFNARNNIFSNNVVSAGGYEQIGIFIVGTLTAQYASTSNNNIIYAGTPGSLHLLYGDGAVNAITNPQQTLAGFQAYVTPRETGSKTELSPFFNTSSGIVNSYLHINPAGGSLAESNAVNIATYTDDYDAEVRQGNGGYTGSGSAPDIGADEFDASIDKIAPDILYTPLSNTSCVSNPTFTATITDNSGVNNTVGTKPRVYYKTSTNANSLGGTNTNTTDGWKYVEATNSSSPYSFTIDYSLVYGGVAAGSVIQYFVTAQDLVATPNVAINSGAFAAAPSSVALTGAAFPISGLINSFAINGTIPTSVTIGVAGTYTTLSGVNGLFADINNKGLAGNTVVNIIDPSVTETGLYALNQMANGCAGTYTLTIKPNAAGTTLTGSLNSAPLIRIKSNYVIIDGSSNGSTSQDLTITNTSATSPNVLLLGSTGTTPITNSTLKNCIIINGVNTSSAVLLGDGLTPGTTGYFNNITIQNNNIQKAYVGIFAVANAVSGNGSGLNITSNTLNTSGANAIRNVGIYLQGIDGATVSSNTIGNFETATAENDIAIWLATSTVNTTVSNNTISTLAYTGVSTNAPVGIYITSNTAASNVVISGNSITGLTSLGTSTTAATSGIDVAFATSGVTISGNKIGSISNTNAGGYGANGIWLASTLTSNVATVYNNFIYDITGYGSAAVTPSSNGYGIVVSSGAGYKIYFNTVYLVTNPTLATSLPAAINITSGVTVAGAIDLRNNILVNDESASTDRYAIYCGAANTVFSNIDYNDYYSAGPNIGFLGSNQSNLAAIQASFGGNTNSLGLDFIPVSAIDLHSKSGFNCGLDGYGTPIAGITTDYDAQTRDVTTPDMGGDEFTAAYSGTLAGVAGSATCENKTVSVLGTTYATSACNLIAKVLPSGGAAVSGKVNTCVTLDATQQTFNAAPYVQRHFDIEPLTANTTTTSATITLYFTDAEFIAYNTANPGWPALPTSALGNADPNRANVRITQYHGTPTTSPSKAGFYTANAGSGVLIIPGAANVVWNGSYWAVTFNVTGFSGFYLHTNITEHPLPVSINYFRGTRQGTNHILDWKVTCNTTPGLTMTLERSDNATGPFAGINTISATAARCNQPFGYTDAQPLKGMNYYRLKMVDADGKITYSGIVALLNAVKGFDIINIAPNPVTSNGAFKLNVASAQAGKMDIVITDMMGRIVNTQTITLIAGYNSIDMNVSTLAAGTYNISGITPDEKTRVIRFVKQ